MKIRQSPARSSLVIGLAWEDRASFEVFPFSAERLMNQAVLATPFFLIEGRITT